MTPPPATAFEALALAPAALDAAPALFTLADVADWAAGTFAAVCLLTLAWCANGAMGQRARINRDRAMAERIAIMREADATRRAVRLALDDR